MSARTCPKHGTAFLQFCWECYPDGHPLDLEGGGQTEAGRQHSEGAVHVASPGRAERLEQGAKGPGGNAPAPGVRTRGATVGGGSRTAAERSDLGARATAPVAGDDLGGRSQHTGGPPSVHRIALSEKQVQEEIKRFFKMLPGNWRVVDTSQPHRAKITPGLPDLLIYGPGVYLEREIKGPNGRQTDAQKEHEAFAKAAGVDYAVWRDVSEAVDWWNKWKGLVLELIWTT